MNNKKRAVILGGLIALTTLCVVTLILQQNIAKKQEYLDFEIDLIQNRIGRLQENIEQDKQIHANNYKSPVCGLETVICVDSTRDVLFTNYYVGDSDNSKKVTASGLTIDDFKTNSKGWYTYDGYVVLASANTTRLDRNLYKDYETHELYDLLTFELDGDVYQGIIIDVCGACFGVETESIQRYDIFTIGNSIGKRLGRIIYEQ